MTQTKSQQSTAKTTGPQVASTSADQASGLGSMGHRKIEPVSEAGLVHGDKTMNQRQQLWEKYTQIPLIIASLAYLVAYTWRVTGELSGDAYLVANWTMRISRALFIIDYLVRLGLAKHRWRWFRENLAALVWSVLPVLRLVLLLRIFTRLQGRRATPGNRMRIRIMVYGAGASAILIYLSALAVLDAERVSTHANIKSFADAIWWACVTVTTTGYGDFTPVTGAGRFVGVTLMFGGMVLLGVTTAILASLMVEVATGHSEDSTGPATKGQIRALSAQLEQMSTAKPAPTNHSPHTESKPEENRREQPSSSPSASSPRDEAPSHKTD